MPAVGRATDTTATGARREGTDLAYALRGWSRRKDRIGRYIDRGKGKWRPNTAVLKAVIKFPKATERPELRDIVVAQTSLGIHHGVGLVLFLFQTLRKDFASLRISQKLPTRKNFIIILIIIFLAPCQSLRLFLYTLHNILHCIGEGITNNYRSTEGDFLALRCVNHDWVS
jgi:hypothetical protein